MKAALGLGYLDVVRLLGAGAILCASTAYGQEAISGQAAGDDIAVVKAMPAAAPAPQAVPEFGAQQKNLPTPAPEVCSSEVPGEPLSAPLITPENQAIASAIADGVTTHLAIAAGAVEANPILPTSPLSLVLMAGVKVGMVKYANTLAEPEKRFTLKSLSSLWGGAAANNLMVLLALPSPVSVIAGILTGVFTWVNMGSRYVAADQALAARNKKTGNAQVQVVIKPVPLELAKSS